MVFLCAAPPAGRSLVAGWKSTEAICCLCGGFGALPQRRCCQESPGGGVLMLLGALPVPEGPGSLDHLYGLLAPLHAFVLPGGPDTGAAAVPAEAGSLRNRAVNLNWSSSAEHRRSFSALRRRCVSPELHKIEADLRLS